MDNVIVRNTVDFTDEILAENGLSSAVNRATLIHDSSTGNSILMPENNLEPPPIDGIQDATVVNSLEELRTNIANVADVHSREVLEEALNELADSMLAESNQESIEVNTLEVLADNLVEDNDSEETTLENNSNISEENTEDEDFFDDDYPEEDNTELVAAAISTDVMDLAMEEAIGDANINTITTSTNQEMIDSLPSNPKSLLAVDETTSRFSGAAWYRAVQESTVILAGLGGIGSYILFLLSRMKPRQIFIYDDDIVELANMSGQLYNKDMVGKKKVNAMAELADKFSEYHGVMAIDSRWDNTKSPSNIMICGFDNMEARAEFFRSWLRHLVGHKNPENCLFLDGRLSAEELQVFCIQGTDKYNIDRYNREYLFTDRQAEQTLCSFKQTSYCANMIGSIMVNLYTNFIANSLSPIIDRDLPFKTYYDASMMYFKTEN